MVLLSVAVASMCYFLLVMALPSALTSTSYKRRCSKIYVHKEWRDLTVKDRLAYIKAVKCLQALPSSIPTIARSRYEDFQATHIDLTERIHLVGHFLPWHRHQINLYGKALRKECGYKGPIAFWDWTRDGDNAEGPLAQSPIFDDVTGFGGNGVPGTYTLPDDVSQTPEPYRYVGCVQTGPFRDSVYTVHLGPGKLKTDHCMVSATWRPILGTENVRKQLASRTFEEFRLVIDDMTNGIHGMGHAAVGGEMTNIYSAGADPLFYLHHQNLDRMWWHWQQKGKDRLKEISGPSTQNGNDTVTLDFEMDFPALGLNVTVGEVMDISKEPNCYTFDY
ncbi:hypothetical protein DFP72DRAFT_973320 [Ephemerocybe angulata]|uniref:Tyrosinase copper-binding domain-containing protein n=1 Tax=Ephemerocybe angulata TaxID=980116 RepID=A0A8H6HIZ0_9AGAR|nr:hypothetical protein DFP72DRAFT_973320 [Tulosesus angulatus]